MQPPDQREFVGFWRRSQTFFFETSQDEAVDRSPDPAGLPDRRLGWPLGRLKCPMARSGALRFLESGRARGDPVFDDFNLDIREFAGGGHLQASGLADSGYDEA